MLRPKSTLGLWQEAPPDSNLYDGGDQARGAEGDYWTTAGRRGGGAAGPPPHLAELRVT